MCRASRALAARCAVVVARLVPHLQARRVEYVLQRCVVPVAVHPNPYEFVLSIYVAQSPDHRRRLIPYPVQTSDGRIGRLRSRLG